MAEQEKATSLGRTAITWQDGTERGFDILYGDDEVSLWRGDDGHHYLVTRATEEDLEGVTWFE